MIRHTGMRGAADLSENENIPNARLPWENYDSKRTRKHQHLVKHPATQGAELAIVKIC